MYFNEQRLSKHFYYSSHSDGTGMNIGENGYTNTGGEFGSLSPVKPEVKAILSQVESSTYTTIQKNYLFLQILLFASYDSIFGSYRENLRRYGILKATDAEIEKFKQISDTDLAKRALRLQAFVKYAGKSLFLYQINADALSSDMAVRALALAELHNRRELNDDLHAGLNLILLMHYHEKSPSNAEAINKLKELEARANRIFAATTDDEKAKLAKDKARFTVMLHKAVDYIENTRPGNKTLPPLFETSKGEKRRSKLALSLLTTLGVITLAIAATAGLAYGGIILLPAFLAWMAPIAFTVLLAAGSVSAVSFIAVLAELIKPKANKYFWQALGRGISDFAKGLLTYIDEANRWKNSSSIVMRNLGRVLAIPLMLLFSPLASGYTLMRGVENYFASHHQYELKPYHKIGLFILGVLTFPLPLLYALWSDSNGDNLRDKKQERARLYDEASTAEKAISAYQIQRFINYETVALGVKRYEKASPADRANFAFKVPNFHLITPPGMPQQSGNVTKAKRLWQLNDKLTAKDLSVEDKLQQAQAFINTCPQKKNTDGSLKLTIFVKSAYQGFERGLFTKPTHWPESISEFKPKAAP